MEYVSVDDQVWLFSGVDIFYIYKVLFFIYRYIGQLMWIERSQCLTWLIVCHRDPVT